MSWLDRSKIVTDTEPVANSKPSWLDRSKLVTNASDVSISNTVTPEPTQVPEPKADIKEYLPDSEIQKIADKYNVQASELRSIAPYYGVKLKPKSFGEAIAVGAKSAAGTAGKALLNLPQFAYKKLQDDNFRQAIDELQGVASKQETPLDIATDIVASPIAGVGKTILPRLASTVGIGAVQGAATAQEGKELEDAATGAVIGSALGGAGELIGAIARKSAAATRNIKPGEIDLYVPKAQANIGKMVDEKLAAQSNSNKLIEESILQNKQVDLTPEQASQLIKEQVGPTLAPTLRDPSTDEGRLLRRSLEDAGLEPTAANLNKKLAQDILDNRTRSFAREVAGLDNTPKIEEARQIIAKEAERNPQLLERYKDWNNTRLAQEAIEEFGIRATSQPGFPSRAVEWLSANEYVARNIDDKYGRNIEKILRDGSNEFNKSTFTLTKFRDLNDKLSDLADNLGIGAKLRENPENIYKALDTGNVTGLSPQEKQFVDKFKQVVEEYRTTINNTGKLNIPRVQNYVPRTIKRTEELIPAVESKINQVLEDASKVSNRKINDIGELNNLEMTQLESVSPALRELLQYRSLITKDDSKKVLPGVLSSFLKESLYSSEGRRKLNLIANAARERTDGNIPDWMIEKDPFRLLDKWSMNTVRAAYMAPTVNKLNNEVKVLKSLGADVDASTIRKMGEDLLGPRSGTMAAATLNARVAFQNKLDKIVDGLGGRNTIPGKVVDNLRVTPEVMQAALSQIYPAVLGARVTPLITNLGGNYVKMVPELGISKYGIGLANKATANNIVNFKQNREIAKQIGNVPAEFIRNQNRAIKEGIQRSGAYKGASSASDAANKTAMYLFTKTEEFNRGVAVELARKLSDDLAAGNKEAIQVINKMPVSMRRFVQSNLNNKPEVTLELAKYFNNVIAQNYNKLSASEFARTAGPLFSAFTKWPSVGLGQAFYELRSKPAIEGLTRVGGLVGTPWLVLQAMDIASGEKAPLVREEDERPAGLTVATGREGLSKLSPVGSIKSAITGEIFTPPAAKLVGSTISKAARENADLEDLAINTAGEAISTFGGGGVALLRLLTQDIPSLISGDKPEGNFFEKTEQGIETLQKGK